MTKQNLANKSKKTLTKANTSIKDLSKIKGDASKDSRRSSTNGITGIKSKESNRRLSLAGTRSSKTPKSRVYSKNRLPSFS